MFSIKDTKSSLGKYLVPLKWRKEPTDQIVKFGDKLIVECAASGNPKPQIKWNRIDGKSMAIPCLEDR